MVKKTDTGGNTETMDICVGCQERITDRYMLRIKGEPWHERCATCKECGTGLQGTCFLRDGILLCRLHYAKLFGARCARCSQPILTDDLIMRALTNVYHVTCFGCIACQRQLRKGDQFILRDGLPLCRFDYEREVAESIRNAAVNSCLKASAVVECESPDESCGGEDDDLDDSDSDSETNRVAGCKRPRTVLTAAQRRKFKAIFDTNSKPNRKIREVLAAETGLSMRVVQVWFQNQRAKMKKISLRDDHGINDFEVDNNIHSQGIGSEITQSQHF